MVALSRRYKKIEYITKKNKNLYEIWKTMRQRCYNPKNNRYTIYGGKGIKICKQWGHYKNFYKWAMDNGYKVGLSIERANNNRDYKPSNCTWIPRSHQAKNTSQNVNIKYKNKTQCLTAWAEELGIKYTTIHQRLARGWSVKNSFEKPLRITKRVY